MSEIRRFACCQDANPRHDGSLSTGHANSCKDMISRLETMVLMGMGMPLAAIRSQIASGIDILVHLGRMRDKSRKVLSITEVVDYKDKQIILNEIYHFYETEERDSMVKGTLEQVGCLMNVEKAERAGYRIEGL